MSRILLLGLNSFSGYRFAESFGNKHAIIGTLRNSDGCPVPENVTREVVPGIMDQRQMETLLAKYAPEVIINFLAMGNVDECERNQDEAKSINLDFPIALARVLKEKEQNCLFVQVSSNAVYDGDSPPYSEDSPKHPVNFYGETKALADKGVLEANENVIIARPITMFGAAHPFQRANPLSFVVERLRNNQPIALVDDLFGNLLWVDDFVRILEGLTSRNLRGEFNIAGPEGIDRWNFGRRIAAVMGLDPNIIRRVGSDEFPSLARRPADTTFDTDKVSSLGLKPTPLDESIELSVQQMEALA